MYVPRNVLLSVILCITACFLFIIISYQKRYKETFASENLPPLKVLILYSSGNPTSQWKKAVPNFSEDVNGITSPTPKFVNTAIVAKMIADYLKKEMLQVTLKEIREIKRADEILFAHVILIGSATHFSNMDWQTKRFFDETLYPFYIHRKMKLKDKYIGCFTTTGGGGGDHCIKSIKRALYDYGSKELPSLIIFSKAPRNDVEKKVLQFTKKLMVKLEKAYAN